MARWAGTGGRQGRLRCGAVVSPLVIWRGGEAVPFPTCAARVSRGCRFTRRRRLAEPQEGGSWVLLPRGRLPPWGTGTTWRWYKRPQKAPSLQWPGQPVFPARSFWPLDLHPGLCRESTGTGQLRSAQSHGGLSLKAYQGCPPAPDVPSRVTQPCRRC